MDAGDVPPRAPWSGAPAPPAVTTPDATLGRAPADVRDAPALRAVLMPLALVLAALAAPLRRPAVLVAGAAALVCVPVGTGEGTTVTPADLAAVCLIAVVGTRLLTGGAVATLRPWVLLAPLGIAAAAVLATITAENQGESLLGSVRFAEIFVLLPLAVALSLRTRGDVAVVLGALVAIGLIEGAVGSHQFLTGTGAGYGSSAVRAVGTFGAYNIMGMSTVVGYAILVCFAWALGAGEGRARLIAAGMGFALCLPLAFSLSRGSWLAVGAGALVMLAASGWRRTIVVGATALALAVVVLSIAPGGATVLSDRLDSIGSALSKPDRSVQDRYDLWGTAVSVWAEHPVTGVGVKNFAMYRDTFAPLGLSGSSDITDPGAGFQRVELLSPHDMYLMFLSEQGIVGLAALLAFACLPLAALVHRMRRSAKQGPERIVALVGLGFVSSWLVNNVWSDFGGATEVMAGILFGVLLWAAAGGYAPAVRAVPR
jgi:O-antigen ligase